MSTVVSLSVTLSYENIEESIWSVLKVIRPQWEKNELELKVIL